MEKKNLCRVILRPDGSVHIAFRDVRSVCATAENLLELFSDPIEFIETRSLSYEDSTFAINRDRVELEDVLGLSLAFVNTDKQIVCNFPELFQFLFASTEEDRSKHLNMSSFAFERVLSDEKSFLLRYYFEFTKNLKLSLAIKKNIKLRNEVQFEIIREILNAYLIEELPGTAKAVSFSSKVKEKESEQLLTTVDAAPPQGMVSAAEYAKLWGCSVNTVYGYIDDKKVRNVTKNEKGHFLLDPNEKPIGWDRRKGRKRNKAEGIDGFYKRKPAASAADVEEHIIKLDLYSANVAHYIHTFEELDYYTKHNYHEININGRPCLVIDCNPDYVSAKTGIRNRDLMKQGKPPVVPDRNKEEYTFHLHHVGQSGSPQAPFATIPAYDHNSKALSSALHPRSTSEDLHGPEFEMQKKNFWRKLESLYNEYDNKFDRIPNIARGRRKREVI